MRIVSVRYQISRLAGYLSALPKTGETCGFLAKGDRIGEHFFAAWRLCVKFALRLLSETSFARTVSERWSRAKKASLAKPPRSPRKSPPSALSLGLQRARRLFFDGFLPAIFHEPVLLQKALGEPRELLRMIEGMLEIEPDGEAISLRTAVAYLSQE